MKITKDLAHLARAVRYGMKTLPSRMTDAQKMQRMKQAAMRRVKAMRPTDYFPGADTGVLRGDWATTINSASSLIRSDYMTLCARSEQLYRTDPWAKRAIQVLDSYIVGQGIKPYPIVKMSNGEIAEGITSRLAQDWERFNDQGIRNGTQQITAYQAQSLEFRTIAVYGNSLCNVVTSRPGSWLRFAFQFIKPTRLDFSRDTFFDSNRIQLQTGDAMIIHGIRLNEYGEPVEFFLQNYDKPISADRMSIAYYPIETESYLGLPWMTASLGNMWDNQQIFEDTLRRSRVGSRLGYRISREDQDSFEAAADSTADSGDTYMDLDFQGFVSTDGEITPVKLDDTIKDSFLPLVRQNLIALGSGMGFSYQVLSSDLEGMNFAASRANIINDNRFFRSVYKWYTKTVLQRRWEKFVEWEVLQNRIPGLSYGTFLSDPWYYTQCYWLPMDGAEWVDPLKDAESIKLLYGLGQLTYEEICSMAGKDYKSTFRQLVKERDMFKEAGMEHLMPNLNNTPVAPAGNAAASKDSGTGSKDQNGDTNL